ncbi:hypothetical protein D3C77_302780 [compost metagenome]
MHVATTALPSDFIASGGLCCRALERDVTSRVETLIPVAIGKVHTFHRDLTVFITHLNPSSPIVPAAVGYFRVAGQVFVDVVELDRAVLVVTLDAYADRAGFRIAVIGLELHAYTEKAGKNLHLALFGGLVLDRKVSPHALNSAPVRLKRHIPCAIDWREIRPDNGQLADPRENKGLAQDQKDKTSQTRSARQRLQKVERII